MQKVRGGLWFYWQTLLGEALVDAGQGSKVADMTKDALKMLQDVLVESHEFAQFYHSDEAKSVSEKGHLAGIAPLRLLHKLFGIRIINTGKVWLSKEFAWGRGVTIRQHGVYVRRTNKKVKVEFPSGHTVELDADFEDDMVVEDPNPAEPVVINPIELPEQVQKAIPIPVVPDDEPSANRVIIEVELED